MLFPQALKINRFVWIFDQRSIPFGTMDNFESRFKRLSSGRRRTRTKFSCEGGEISKARPGCVGVWQEVLPEAGSYGQTF